LEVGVEEVSQVLTMLEVEVEEHKHIKIMTSQVLVQFLLQLVQRVPWVTPEEMEEIVLLQ
jgi:hypothetical protein